MENWIEINFSQDYTLREICNDLHIYRILVSVDYVKDQRQYKIFYTNGDPEGVIIDRSELPLRLKIASI